MSNTLGGGDSSWEELIAWDEELYDPLFQGDTSFTGRSECLHNFSSEYHVSESVTSDQPWAPSAPTSVADGPSSFDYTLSAPPSVVDGPSSIGQTFSWLSASPSFSTTATSPLIGKDEREYASAISFCHGLSSPVNASNELPLARTEHSLPPESFNSSNSFQTASTHIFNPFLATSPQAFSSLDVAASQAFASVGGWVDQPQIVEPSPELEHEGAIPIPQPGSLVYSNTFPSIQWSQEIPQERSRPRAITIPQSNHQAIGYNQSLHPSQRALEIPPILSISPDARPRPRSNTSSKRVSTSEPRRGQNSLTTPSPTLGWVSYQPNLQTNRLVPSGADGNRGRRQRGRTKALTLEQRRNAALMRVVGACSNCKKRKEKCDLGIPCKSCLEHFKGDLIHYPCRDRLLSDLSSSFLSERLGWHPTSRALESFMEPSSFNMTTGLAYTIPLNLGFGPLLFLPTHAIEVYDSNALYHKHVIYSWLPGSSTGDIHTHVVLPAALTPEALDTLSDTLDTHLSLLVTQHFRSFPLYASPLRILREVYIFYRSLPTNTPHSRLLHQSLKLLVLVHIGGDLTLPTPSSDPILAQLVRTSMALDLDEEEITPTPCFIRSQLGSVMPTIALSLMKDVLFRLEQLFLNRECHEWPVALAVLIIVLMTIESIQYHAAKLPYHHKYDTKPTSGQKAEEMERKVDEQGIKSLFSFYTACFSGCHARLRPDWEGEAGPSTENPNPGFSPNNQSPDLKSEDKFIESVREAVKRASQAGYLAIKANEEREGEDMVFFFDRLVARLLLLRTT
ncbi:uncharacterized protein BDR25DRAFT_301288 [Lindgomyces ingoldianus]|uniref:Uncharacterized protein n=1 Tax=Lindgomyces ingoldianus TaxID=673940 RepID=A0ACB6R6B5_9PLEO|nr:uncharacterized protein BDR25DRAFT_301288 [Lindgomyces ingoldianus]KAF2474600.1 hypothetical protein BDR25DRAFT_301288 [Lindgomyces ingoldianus]